MPAPPFVVSSEGFLAEETAQLVVDRVGGFAGLFLDGADQAVPASTSGIDLVVCHVSPGLANTSAGLLPAAFVCQSAVPVD